MTGLARVYTSRHVVECENEFGRGETEICPLSLVVAALNQKQIHILLINIIPTPYARFELSRTIRNVLFSY